MKRDRTTKKLYSDYMIGDISNSSKKNVSSMKIFIPGGIAGVISWIIGYPLDTLKTRIQSGFYNNSISVRSLRRNYSLSFYGLMPALYRAALLNSCIFLMYE